MIPNLYFDEETRSFSNFNDMDLEVMNEVYSDIDETREFGEKWDKAAKFMKSNPHFHAGLAGAGLGTASTLVARKIAKKKALELGLEPGTPEYKKFIAKYMVAAGVVGAEVGVGVAYGGHAIANKIKDKRSKALAEAKSQGYAEGRRNTALAMHKRVEALKKKRESDLASASADKAAEAAMAEERAIHAAVNKRREKEGKAAVAKANKTSKLVDVKDSKGNIVRKRFKSDLNPAEEAKRDDYLKHVFNDEENTMYQSDHTHEDIENYLFSDIDTRTFGKKWDATKAHLKKDMHVHAGLAAIGGSGLGTGIGYAMAKKAAIKAGLEPGTPEFKRFVRKRMAAAAAIGAGAGIVGAYGTHASIALAKGLKARKGIQDKAAKKAAFQEAFKGYYKTHGHKAHLG